MSSEGTPLVLPRGIAAHPHPDGSSAGGSVARTAAVHIHPALAGGTASGGRGRCLPWRQRSAHRQPEQREKSMTRSEGTPATEKLSPLSKLAFAAGDLAPAIVSAVNGFFLNAFLLDVAGRRHTHRPDWGIGRYERSAPSRSGR